MKIRISLSGQTLTLENGPEILCTHPVSTSSSGVGTEPGSFKTPSGRFRICEKIGYRAPQGMCFRGRLPCGLIGEQQETSDLIMSRILWLDGLDMDNRNTRDRYIYIHGTNHEHLLGTPASHGCVRMANADIIQLYELVAEGTGVEIVNR